MKIYKNFDDYWANGNHGCSSFNKDIAKEIWDDFEPTIKASRTDYENLLIEEALEQKRSYIEQINALHDYLKEFKVEEYTGVKFFRWWWLHSEDNE